MYVAAIVLNSTARADFTQDPAPSNDPNDPLNWPTWAKVRTYATICLFSFIANVNGSNFTVAIVPLEKHFHISATRAVGGKYTVYLRHVLMLLISWSRCG